MKKKLALILAATMTVSLLASCGGSGSTSGSASQSAGSGASASASQTSDLKVGVFYYNFADAYITTVRTAMDKQLEELGVQYQNFDAQTNQGEQLNQVNTAISDGYNLLVVNVVENASPDAAQNIADAAKAAGIPGYVVARKDFASNREMTIALVDKLRELNIGLVVLAGFLHILTGEMVAAFPNAILNVHPALIPSFAGPGCYGLHVHEKALEYGVKLSGATVHFVSEECDGGPIVLQKAVEVLPDDTPGDNSLELVFMLLGCYSCVSTAISTGIDFIDLCMIPIISRSIAGLNVLLRKPMGHSQYAEGAGADDRIQKRKAVIIILIQLIVYCTAGAFLSSYLLPSAIVVAVTAAATYLSAVIAKRRLGGMSGDIAGYAITWGEFFGIFAMLIL